MLRSTRTLLALALAFACVPAPAQFVAARITFRNPGPYTQAELQQTAMLLTGEHTGTPGIQAAAQRLIDTGYFDDVQVDTKGSREALEVIFILKPNPPGHSTRVGFENFVWFTPEELQALLHKAVPLFRGELPEAGNQTDALSAALQAALAAKGISAQVSHEPVEPTTLHPMRAIEFRAEPAVRVGTISLTGVPPELAASEDKLVQRLSGSLYNEGLAGETTTGQLLAPSQNAGYLEAKLTGLRRSVNAAGRVDVTATLEPGPVYHVGSLSFAATPVLTQDAVMAGARLHPRDVASRQQLLLTMLPIDTAYKKLGYMDEYVDPGQTLDSAAHTASYRLTVVPGEIYRLRTVTPLGLSAAAEAEFHQVKRIQPGDVYDVEYVTHLVENNSSLRALATYKATFEAAADPNTHLVDLTLKFSPSGVPPRR